MVRAKVRKKCVVKNCPTNAYKPDKRGFVFCLPRNDEKRWRWLQLLGREDLGMSFSKALVCAVGVCYMHFSDHHYRTSEKKSLNSNANPNAVSGVILSDIKPIETSKILSNEVSENQLMPSESHCALPEPEIVSNDSPDPSNINDIGSSIFNSSRNLQTGKSYQKLVKIIKNNTKYRKKSGLLDENGPKKQVIRAKIEEYMKRAETIKTLIANLKEHGNYHEQIRIESNSTGHSYEVIFKRFLEPEVISVNIEDPYIRSYHQCQNLVMFCELLVRNCPNLRTIQLLTTKDQNAEQERWLNELKQSLIKFNISLSISYSSTLHDRQIKFSTGWTIKIGRGLDYFKKADGKFCIGAFDYNLRPCHETTVDVFHQSNVKQSYG